MSKKPDNHCERCHNPVLCDAPHNFVCENPTWIEDLLNDPALWKSIDDDAFPEPISHELLRLRSIFEQRQVFAMVFQIKDVGEVLMKFPVLCSAAYLKNDVITKKLIEKPLSLGDWQSIASELLKQSQNQYIYDLPEPFRFILSEIWDMYQESRFVNQRNRFIGHGALGFDDNAEYRHYCENMLSAIAKHLERVNEAYRHLKLSVNDDNAIFVTIEGENIALTPFIVRLGENLCFFDYLDGRKQIPPAYGLDYVNGGSHKRFDAPYLAEAYRRFDDISHSDFVVENSVSDLEAERVLASMNGASSFTTPEALKQWIVKNVPNECVGGVHLLTMERGMGKTAFVYALESGVIPLKDVKVCAYYCSHAQMRGVGNFIQGIMNSLRGILTDVVYRTLPQLRLDHENRAGNLLEVLKGYKREYTKRGEGSRLLLILDGLDEIPADQADVFEYIPKSEDMPENIYILLTARNPEREQLAPHVVEALNKLSIGSHYEVMPDSPENQATLRTYLSKQDMVKTERGFRRPTNAEIERLLELSGNTFINLSVYSKLVSAGYAIDTLPELNNEQLFSHYLSILRSAYGEKLYNEALRVLVMIATAYENLTLQELAYLCGYPGITLQLLAFIKDFGALIKAVRSNVRGTELAIANDRYREYVESNFADELRQMTVELVDRILAEDVQDYQSGQGIDSIPDGVLYLAAYVAEYLFCHVNNVLDSADTSRELWNKIKICGLAVTSKLEYQLIRECMCYTGIIKLLLLTEDDNNLAKGYMNRAVTYHALIRDEDALADYSRAIEIGEHLHQEGRLLDENFLAVVYMNRAVTHHSLTHYQDAVTDYSRAIEIAECLHQEGKLSDENFLATFYTNRAVTYATLTRYQDALADHFHAVEIRECLYRQECLHDENDLAIVYMNRAITYCCHTLYEHALADCSRAIEIRERLHRERRLSDENDLATSYMNRANTYDFLTRYEDALADITRAVSICERLHREGRLPDENDLAKVYMSRANTYDSLVRYEDALADITRAVSICERLHREGKLPDENYLAAVYMNRANTYRSLTRYEDALADYARAIEIWERLHREGRLYDINDLLRCYLNKAISLGKSGDSGKAVDECTKGIALCEELPVEKLSSVMAKLINLYTYRAITYRDKFLEVKKAKADFARVRQLKKKKRLNNWKVFWRAISSRFFCI